MNLNATHVKVFYFEIGNRKLLRHYGVLNTGKSVLMVIDDVVHCIYDDI